MFGGTSGLCCLLDYPDEDVFGIDGNRILLLHRGTAGDDKLEISRSLLMRHPRIQLKFGLSDAHMYLIERSVLEFVLDNMYVCWYSV